MRKVLDVLIKSIIAGILISIAGISFIIAEEKTVGALLFSVGLFFIVEENLKLYTGSVGYLLDNKRCDNLMLIVILFGNYLGAFLSAILINLTRISDIYKEKVALIVSEKLSDTVYSILILAFFCGILIYLGVDVFKKSNNMFSKTFAILICIFVFVMCGFEHSIANMFYFSLSNTYTLKAFLYLIIMVIGNLLGGIFIPGLLKLVKRERV